MEGVEPMQLGDIWLHRPNVTPGYFENDEATNTAFYVDSDGTGSGLEMLGQLTRRDS